MSTVYKDMTGTFKNPLSTEKIVSRNHMIGFVEALLSKEMSIQALTLPANNFLFERKLKHYCATNKQAAFISCVEADDKVFYDGKTNEPPHLVSEYRHEDVFMYLLTTLRKFNFIWLDLCSCLSDQLVSELENVVDSTTIDDTCVFSITLQKGRETSLELGEETLGKYRKEVFPKRLQEAASKVNRDCKLLEVYNYRSTNKVSAPMSIYTFLITKQTEDVNKNSQILHT